MSVMWKWAWTWFLCASMSLNDTAKTTVDYMIHYWCLPNVINGNLLSTPPPQKKGTRCCSPGMEMQLRGQHDEHRNEVGRGQFHVRPTEGARSQTIDPKTGLAVAGTSLCSLEINTSHREYSLSIREALFPCYGTQSYSLMQSHDDD